MIRGRGEAGNALAKFTYSSILNFTGQYNQGDQVHIPYDFRRSESYALHNYMEYQREHMRQICIVLMSLCTAYSRTQSIDYMIAFIFSSMQITITLEMLSSMRTAPAVPHMPSNVMTAYPGNLNQCSVSREWNTSQ
jgi:hypothetical protein